MKSELLPYYERELFFIRQLAAEFAEQHPDRARGLELHPDTAADPHVERLIEAFALIAGRIHHKIDDEFPEISEALLEITYPHYLRPIPPMSVAQFEMDPEQKQASSGHTIEQGSSLFASANGAGSLGFRTCFPTTLWPLKVTAASFLHSSAAGLGVEARQVPYVIRIGLQTLGGLKLRDLSINRLRFFVGGEPQTAFLLYEQLFNNTSKIILRSAVANGQAKQVVLSRDRIKEVGFGRDEGMLPYSNRSFLGYRLLQEYFSFPQKFLFFDLDGVQEAVVGGFGDELEINILVNEVERKDNLPLLQQAVSPGSFLLGCAPVVNLFERCAEPIRLTQAKTEYRVVPDLHFEKSTEVYSIDRVVATAPYTEETQEYQPFYSLRHTYGARAGEAFWHATRRRSERQGDDGTDVYLSLLDLNFRPHLPPAEALTAYVTCTNRDQVEEVNWNRSFGELQMESSALCWARFVLKPSSSYRAPRRRGLQWGLISHLGLNYLSIVEGGAEALKEMLRLYNFSDSPAISSQIEGLTAISTAPEVARVLSDNGLAFARGLHTTIEFDEQRYPSGSVFLFGSILEKFLALYSTLNSFSKLSVVSQQSKGVLKVWPARAGEQILV